MSEGKLIRLAQGKQVFISSKTTEMNAYRSKAIEAIQDVGMRHKTYNDPRGAGFTQGSKKNGGKYRPKTIFEQNRETVEQSDVFVGLYGHGGVWRPAFHPGLREEHPELMADPEKLIMEYEQEWAEQAGLFMFRFMRTQETVEVPFEPIDARMDQYRDRLMSQTVGWLTTPESFYHQLVDGLRGIIPRVFLSYSRQNMDYVSRLQRQLRDEDIHAWRDTNIPGGTEWAQEIETALDRMDALVVVLTPEAAKSEWVKKECRAFIGHGKAIIPYIANAASTASLPKYLSSIQYIDGTRSEGFSILTKELRAVLRL